MTAVEILTKARELLARPKAWIKGDYARASNGHPVTSDSKSAVCWCASGALTSAAGPFFRVNADERIRARKALGDAVRKAHPKFGGVEEFNDASRTRKRDVLALFDLAIRRAKKTKPAKIQPDLKGGE